MNKKLAFRFSTVALTLAALTACQGGYTPQPRATMFPASNQNVLRSAGHWDVLAANEADSVRNVVPAGSLLGVPNPSPAHSPFEQAYRNMLTSQLVGNGVQVALSPASAVYQLEYDVQVVKHTDRDSLWPRPGTATAFFAIGTLAANVRHWSDQSLAMIPAALGLEYLTLLWRDTEGSITEVIVNSRVHDGVRLLAANSNVYYFRDDDQHNFTGGGRAFPVVARSVETNVIGGGQ
ncbi:MAG: hypothetical protein Q7W55_15355 [Pseudohongiella sp.]|nr:hypothetical protein [Pseudohongiella sp.]MDO9519238.1 hypothetical protein [Pseudohongiella sp.]MDP2128349.1 hypothetical protein [Pseudohongiella sp.]